MHLAIYLYKSSLKTRRCFSISIFTWPNKRSRSLSTSP
nr:MAG TPA: hypothetical protein [Caudoviricetes sp.]